MRSNKEYVHVVAHVTGKLYILFVSSFIRLKVLPFAALRLLGILLSLLGSSWL